MVISYTQIMCSASACSPFPIQRANRIRFPCSSEADAANTDVSSSSSMEIRRICVSMEHNAAEERKYLWIEAKNGRVASKHWIDCLAVASWSLRRIRIFFVIFCFHHRRSVRVFHCVIGCCTTNDLHAAKTSPSLLPTHVKQCADRMLPRDCAAHTRVCIDGKTIETTATRDTTDWTLITQLHSHHVNLCERYFVKLFWFRWLFLFGAASTKFKFINCRPSLCYCAISICLWSWAVRFVWLLRADRMCIYGVASEKGIVCCWQTTK